MPNPDWTAILPEERPAKTEWVLGAEKRSSRARLAVFARSRKSRPVKRKERDLEARAAKWLASWARGFAERPGNAWIWAGQAWADPARKWALRLDSLALQSPSGGALLWASLLAKRQALQRRSLKDLNERKRWAGGAGSGLPIPMAYPARARAEMAPFAFGTSLPSVIAPSRWLLWERAPAPLEIEARFARTPVVTEHAPKDSPAVAALSTPGLAVEGEAPVGGHSSNAANGAKTGAATAARADGSAARLAAGFEGALPAVSKAAQALRDSAQAWEDKDENRAAQAVWRRFEALARLPNTREEPSKATKLRILGAAFLRGQPHAVNDSESHWKRALATPLRALRSLPRGLWAWEDFCFCLSVLREWPPASWRDPSGRLRGSVAAGLILQLGALGRDHATALGEPPPLVWGLVSDAVAQLVEGVKDHQASQDASWAWPRQEQSWERDLLPLHHLALRTLCKPMLEIVERAGIDVALPGEMGDEPMEALGRGIYKAYLSSPVWRKRALDCFEFLGRRALSNPSLRRSVEFQLKANARAFQARAQKNPRDFTNKVAIIAAFQMSWEAMQLQEVVREAGSPARARGASASESEFGAKMPPGSAKRVARRL